MNEILKYGRPESSILLKHLVDTFNPSSIVPLYYQGVIAGSEFLTYAANKLYYGLSFRPSKNSGWLATLRITFYDETNTISFAVESLPYFDTVAGAIRAQIINTDLNDFYFSRLLQVGYLEMKFIGYRIII